MSRVNSFYIVPSNPLSWFPEKAAAAGLQPSVQMALAPGGRSLASAFGNARWGGHSIPGDPQGRWLMDVEHSEGSSELAMAQLPGVIALPHVYDPTPLGAAVAGVLAFANVLATDTMLQALAKLRAAGIVGARPEPQ